jgi:hypothetical protein
LSHTGFGYLLAALGEPVQPAVGRSADRAGALVQDLGGGLGVQTDDDPQQFGLGLIRW